MTRTIYHDARNKANALNARVEELAALVNPTDDELKEAIPAFDAAIAAGMDALRAAVEWSNNAQPGSSDHSDACRALHFERNFEGFA